MITDKEIRNIRTLLIDELNCIDAYPIISDDRVIISFDVMTNTNEERIKNILGKLKIKTNGDFDFFINDKTTDIYKKNNRYIISVKKSIKLLLPSTTTSTPIFNNFGGQKTDKGVLIKLAVETKKQNLKWLAKDYGTYFLYTSSKKLGEKRMLTFTYFYSVDKIESSWLSINYVKLGIETKNIRVIKYDKTMDMFHKFIERSAN